MQLSMARRLNTRFISDFDDDSELMVRSTASDRLGDVLGSWRVESAAPLNIIFTHYDS